MITVTTPTSALQVRMLISNDRAMIAHLTDLVSRLEPGEVDEGLSARRFDALLKYGVHTEQLVILGEQLAYTPSVILT